MKQIHEKFKIKFSLLMSIKVIVKRAKKHLNPKGGIKPDYPSDWISVGTA
jgi:hypothetical protein